MCSILDYDEIRRVMAIDLQQSVLDLNVRSYHVYPALADVSQILVEVTTLRGTVLSFTIDP